MILGSKHFGAILNVLCKNFYVSVLFGVLIESLHSFNSLSQLLLQLLSFLYLYTIPYRAPYS